MPSEIRVPFSIAPDGSIGSVSDPDQQVRQRVYALLGTDPGERVMLTDYGVETRNALFDPDDSTFDEMLADKTREQMEVYEPGVMVTGVLALDTEPGSGEARIKIDYVRRESPATPAELAGQTNIAIIGVGGAVDEVVSG